MESFEARAKEFVKFQASLGFYLTRRCPLECEHCYVRARPGETLEVDLNDLLGWIEQAAQIPKVKGVSFSGGEPFLCFEKLQAAVRFAVDRGLAPSALTSCYWAHRFEVAVELLTQLNGLELLVVSIDPYHQRDLPLERALNAIRAARSLGIMVGINVTPPPVDNGFLDKVQRAVRPILDPGVNVSLSFLAYTGRAAEDLICHAEMVVGYPQGACSVMGPAVTEDGTVFACCSMVDLLAPGNPLVLGSLRTENLGTILERSENDCLIQCLRTYGPSKLASMALSTGSVSLRGTYPRGDICSVCFDMFSRDNVNTALREACGRDADLQLRVAAMRLLSYGEEEMFRALLAKHRGVIRGSKVL